MKQVAIVTGALGGVGLATVGHLASRGWDVVGMDVRAGSIRDAVLQITCDLADDDAARRAYADIAQRFPVVHALVNNAALQIAKRLVDTTAAEWDAVMTTNARGAFLGIKYCHLMLKAARGAAIVNVASVHANVTSAGLGAYAASKAAIVSLTRTAALELAPDGIRVNAILPGAVDTPMLRHGLGRGHLGGDSTLAQIAELSRKTPVGRVAEPIEIARAIGFLTASEQSSFMTGQTLVVDGGATARLSTE